MILKQLSLKQSLNDAYRLIKPERTDIEKFKSNFKLLLSNINPKESEENMKGQVMDFLKNTYYNPNYLIAICVVRSGGFIEVKPQYFEQIPVPEISNKEQQPFIELTNQILAAKKKIQKQIHPN